MSKNWEMFLITLMLALVLLLGSAALAEGIPLEEALTQVESGQGRVLLSDDFSMYDYYNSDSYTGNSGKFVVLYRIGPEKEFTISNEKFADEFNGVDIGKPEVYLDLDTMAMIPEEYRASTVDEIGNIIMFETFYLHTATITSRSSLFEDKVGMMGLYAAMLDETEEPAELPGEKEEFAYEYKSVFTGYAVASLYNAEDGTSISFDDKEYLYPEMRKNPEASEISSMLFQLASLYNACLEQDEDMLLLNGVNLMMHTEELGEDRLSALFELLSVDTIDYAVLEALLTESIWDGAARLRELDAVNAKYYDLVIEDQSLNGLYYLLNNCDYNNINQSDILIRLSKDYMGDIDMADLEVLRSDTVEFMEMLQWDPEMLYLLILLGE